MDWQNIVGIAGFIIAVGSISGIGLMRDRLSVLKDSNEDLRARDNDRGKELADIRTELAEVQAENRLLKAMVTGRVEWTAISDQLEEHHRQSLAAWKRIENKVGGR
jgi:hypothetical protein